MHMLIIFSGADSGFILLQNVVKDEEAEVDDDELEGRWRPSALKMGVAWKTDWSLK